MTTRGVSGRSSAMSSTSSIQRTGTIFIAALTGDLDRDDPDPVRDGAGFRQAALWLSDEELEQLRARLVALPRQVRVR